MAVSRCRSTSRYTSTRFIGIPVTLVILFLLYILTGTLSAQLKVAPNNNGEIDWEAGVIRVKGTGAVNPDDPPSAQRAGAIRAAKMDAWRNFLEIVQGVRIDAQTTVRNYMLEDDRIRTSIQGIITSFRQLGEPHYLSDGSIEVEYEMPIYGNLADLFLPKEMGRGKLLSGEIYVCPLCGREWPKGKPVPPGIKLKAISSFKKNPTGRPYTGLIVDARGFTVYPAMAPKILNKDGEEVYGTGFVSRDYALKVGIVGYARDLEKAMKNPRVADNPLVIKAIGSSGKAKTDVIISNKDAINLHALSENLNFLDKCRVIFLVD